ncbi:MAG TPA: hypothetical protein VIS96_06095 [Terrimicrobiaceae bacterium]
MREPLFNDRVHLASPGRRCHSVYAILAFVATILNVIAPALRASKGASSAYLQG